MAGDINELESKISFLERSLEQLNEVLVKHGETIDTHQKEILLLKGQIEQQGKGEIEPHDSPPPHW